MCPGINTGAVSGQSHVEAKQQEVADFWNAEPCDSENSHLATDTRDYYLEIEVDRYAHQGHILEILSWLDWRGDVLEIGTGVGTDARELIARGAKYHGINVDEGSCDATRNALAAFGLNGVVQRMSATAMSFLPCSFDAIYSFGVLHHIPDVDKAVANIGRVLKPGGCLLFMVYNRRSINHEIEIRCLRRWALRLLVVPGIVSLFGRLGFPKDKLLHHVELYRKLGTMSEEEWLSRNTDGPDNPYSTVYGSEQITDLLGSSFHILKDEVFFFDWRHWGLIGRALPSGLVHWLGRHWGWHRVVLARKMD